MVPATTVEGLPEPVLSWAGIDLAYEAEGYQTDWIEMALVHSDEDMVRGACNSALYLSARRSMLQDWADHSDNCREKRFGSRTRKTPPCKA